MTAAAVTRKLIVHDVIVEMTAAVRRRVKYVTKVRIKLRFRVFLHVVIPHHGKDLC
jgi:hypothetical protein